MANTAEVCCMCGDVGFIDKLFPCRKCHNRYQHLYCSNFYSESSNFPVEVCDWCHAEGKQSTSKKLMARNHDGATSRSDDGKVKVEVSTDKTKNPSPKSTNRRYKLLKDVLC